MSRDRDQPRGPAPQRSPGELADLLASMSQEAPPRRRRGQAAAPAGDETTPTRPGPPEPAPAESTPEPVAPVVPQPVSPAPADAVAPAAPEPVPAVPPAPVPPAPVPAAPPEPASPGVPEAEPAAEPPPPAAESDVVVGTPIVAGVARPTPPPDSEPAPVAAQTSGPRPRSRGSARGRRRSKAPRPTLPSVRRGRSGPVGRGPLPPAPRSRGARLLRFGVAAVALVVLLIVILAVVSPTKKATTTPSNPGVTSITSTPPPASGTTTSTNSGSTGHRPTALRGAGSAHDVMILAGFPSGAGWSPALAAASSSLLVIDPADGPGARPNPGLNREISAARRKGAVLLGFVDTAAGSTPLGHAETQMADYRRWYGIDDVFLAGAPESPARLSYYRTLAAGARAHGATLVTLEPSRVPARAYFSIANVIVTFAGRLPSFRSQTDPGWLSGIAADRKADLVFGVSSPGRARAALSLAAARGAGIAYVTSATGPRAFSSVPAYLGQESSWLSRARRHR